MQDRLKQYHELGMIGTSNAVPANTYVDYATSEIDLGRVFDGRQDCFIEPALTTQLQKKKIIISDWSALIRYRPKFFNEDGYVGHVRQLMSDGFEVYIWTGELVRVKPQDDIGDLLQKIEVQHRDAIAAKLPAYQLSADECYIADMMRWKRIMNGSYHSNLLLLSSIFPKLLPASEIKKLLQTIADEDDAMIAPALHLDSELKVYLEEFLKKHRKLYLTGKGQKNWDGREACWPLLEELTVLSGSGTCENLAEMLANSKALKELTLYQGENAAAEYMNQLRAPQLQQLKYSDSLVTDAQLKGALDHAQLSSLYLNSCDNITVQAFSPQVLQRLEDLNFGNMPGLEGSLCGLLQQAKQLKKLNFSHQTKLDDVMNNPVQLPELSELKMIGRYDVAVVAKLLAGMPKLRQLRMQYYSQKDDEKHELVNIDHAIHLPELQHFECSNQVISIQNLNALFSEAKSLETVKISGAFNPGNARVNFKLPALKKIDLYQVALSSQQMCDWLAGSPDLEDLKLSSCSELGENLIGRVKLNKLKSLGLRGFKKSSRHMLQNMMLAAPHVKSVIINDCDTDLSLPQSLLTTEVTDLQVLNVSMTGKQLMAWIDRSPQLKKLQIHNCKGFGNDYPRLSRMSELEELDLSAVDMTPQQLLEILRHTPHLKKLELSSNTNLMSCIEKCYLPELEELEVNSKEDERLSLYDMARRFPKLQSLTINGCDLGGVKGYAFAGLVELKKLSLRPTNLNGMQLENIVAELPQLRKLDISGSHSLTRSLKDSKRWNLPRLKTLHIDYLHATAADIDVLVSAIPQLQKISMYNMTKINPDAAKQLKKKYPLMKFSYSKADQDIKYAMSHGIYYGSGKTGQDEFKVPVQKIFHSIDKGYPEVNRYRKKIFTDIKYNIQTGRLEMDEADGKNYTPVQCDIHARNLRDKYESGLRATKKHLLGEDIIGMKVSRDGWYSLDTVNPGDKITHIETMPPTEIEIQYDEDESLYYIRPKYGSSLFHVTYLVEHARHNVFKRDPADINAVLQVDADFNLIAYGDVKAQLEAMSELEKINYLVNYLHFDDQKRTKPESANRNGKRSDLSVVNEILAKKTGSCQHRSIAFMMLAKALHLKARGVVNDCHMYCEVKINNQWQTVDLGGWPVILDEHEINDDIKFKDLMDDIYKKYQIEEDLIEVHEVDAEDNPFTVWNTFHSHAENADDYAREILQQVEQLPDSKRNVLSLLDTAKIPALHSAFLQSAQQAGHQCYYVHHLDDIRESSYVIDSFGGYTRRDSELADMIRHAKKGDILLVNWSDYEAKHIGFNTMLDSERSICGIPVPEGVSVIGLLDQKVMLREDFYSRFRVISECPEAITAEYPLLAPVAAPSPELTEIVFYDQDWKRDWYGYYHVGDQGFQFMTSALLQAVASHKPGVVLRNAPWHVEEFRLAVAELLHKRRIYVNGRYHDIPEDFKLERDDTPLSLDFDNYQVLPVNDMHRQHYVLNMATLAHFFDGYHCQKNGVLAQNNGVLKHHQHQTISLLVTDELADSAWVRLLKEAQENHVHLKLYCERNVKLPAAMMTKVQTVDDPAPIIANQIESEFNANVVTTNDIELAYHQRVQSRNEYSMRIPVNAKTTYADLIESMSIVDEDNKKKFIHKKSALTRALLSGKHVILTGEISPLLARQLAPLFMKNAYLVVNGEHVALQQGSLTFITDKKNHFQSVAAAEKKYTDDEIYSSLSGNDEHIQILRKLCALFYAAVPDYPHFTFVQLNNMLQRMTVMPMNNPLNAFLRLDKRYPELKPLSAKAWQDARVDKSWIGWLKRKNETKPHREEDPITKRLRKINDELLVSPYVFAAGSSGTGKSHFVESDLPKNDEDTRVFSGLDKIQEWLNAPDDKRNILFIDEANLYAPGTFEIFAGLMQDPPVIMLNGTRHRVGNHLKIIFAGNFSHYKSRQEHGLFNRYGHVITFKEFPDSFLAEHMITPALKAALDTLTPAQQENLTHLFLRSYHHINRQFPDTHPLTARNLQMMVLRTAYNIRQNMSLREASMLAVYDEVSGYLDQQGRREFRNKLQTFVKSPVDIKAMKHELKEKIDLSTPEFQLTDNRRNPVRHLDNLLGLRDMKIADPRLATSGTTGILFEGESGIGKSLMAREYLLAHGYAPADMRPDAVNGQHSFYQLTPTDPLRMQAILIKAFHEGAVVIIDEMNALPLEYVLNPLLSGVDLDGKKAEHPGFFVIATQNPSSFNKRHVLSAASINRFQKYDLKDYQHKDLMSIAGKHAAPGVDIKKNVDDFSAARLFARANHKMMPTMRHLVTAVTPHA